MKRLNRLLLGSALLSFASTAMGAGGVAPPPDGAAYGGKFAWKGIIKVKTFVEDDERLSDISSARKGTIQLLTARKGTLLSQVDFKALPTVPWISGCATDLTFARFNQSLTSIMSKADVRLLFAPLGLVPNDEVAAGEIFVPYITAVTNPTPGEAEGNLGECVFDPENEAAPDLFIEVVIEGCIAGGCAL